MTEYCGEGRRISAATGETYDREDNTPNNIADITTPHGAKTHTVRLRRRHVTSYCYTLAGL